MKLQHLFIYMFHFHYYGLRFRLIMKLLLFIVTSTITVVIHLCPPFVYSDYLLFHPGLKANETQKEAINTFKLTLLFIKNLQNKINLNYQLLYCPTDLLNYINFRVIKTH